MTKSAFTLAEVLITLGIIGIVASLTIPTLMAKNQKNEAYTALQKALSVISSATAQMREDNGGSMADIATDASGFADALKPYLHVIKSCTDTSDCYLESTDTIKALTGQTFARSTEMISEYPKIVTSDGFVFIMGQVFSQCDAIFYKQNGENQYCTNLYVDTNGKKKPNTVGKDLFSISINKYNTTPYLDMHGSFTTPESSIAAMCNMSSPGEWAGAVCAYKAIMDGGIKYY
ncbi:type II secretion system protein [bacterium]|nr:type II secretion system protein [bacterium]